MSLEKKLMKIFILFLPLALSLLLIPLFTLTIALVTLPGFITVVLFLRDKLKIYETLILGIGIGFTLLTVFTYLLKITGVPLNIYTLFFYFALFASLFLKFGDLDFRYFIGKFSEVSKPLYVLSLLLTLGIVTRILPTLNMNAPLFADPAVEGTIAKLIIQSQGIPNTWKPFLPINLNHQPGFASITSVFHLLSGISIPRIILLLTNLIHAIFPVSIFFLGNTLFENQKKAVIASFIALAAAFPSYIFMAGMNSAVTAFSLIPIGTGLLIESLESASWRNYLLLFLMSFGAILIHPLYLFFLVLLGLPYLFYHHFKRGAISPKNLLMISFSAVLIPLLLTLPHYSGALGSSNLVREQWHFQSEYINPEERLTPRLFVEPIYTLFDNMEGGWYWYRYLSLTDVLFGVPGLLITGLFLYTIYIIFDKRMKLGYLLLGWYLLFLFFSTFQSALKIEFPGWQYVYPSRVKFLISLPVSLILASSFNDNDENSTESGLRKISLPLIVLILSCSVSLVFVTNHMFQLSKRTVVSDYDLKAMRWIDENVNKGEVILNPISDVETGAFIGGPGQWIPSYTGRKVLYPTASLTGNLEKIQDRTEVMEMIDEAEVNSEKFSSLLKKYNISYIYISENKMSWGNRFSWPFPELFEESEFYRVVYENEDVKIFEVKKLE